MKTDFLWGVATSSHQIEGGNRHNDWWAWEAEGRIDGGVRSGQACDHWNPARMREDLELAKSLGLNTYRFSFEWSRFEPRQGDWEANAVEGYTRLLDLCDELGLLPMATLHHFSTPRWLAEKGGFASDESPPAFADFTRKIAKTFGSRIPLWCTINEPMVLMSGAYLGRFMPPGEHRPKDASRACYNLLRSHVLAFDILKKEITTRRGPFASHPLMVGFAHNMMFFRPERKSHLIERFIARLFDAKYNHAWLKAVSGEKQSFGCIGVMPQPNELKSARGRRTYDFIGVNYYTKAYVQWRPRTQTKERDPNMPIGLSFAHRLETASDLGWAIYPKGFARILESLRRYRAPIYITENGIADQHDSQREEYLKSHLRQVAGAIEDGLDIRGYYHWSLIDNFEWIKGFGPRFGLFHVDYETFKRTERPSADVYRTIVKKHGAQKPQVAWMGESQPDLERKP